MRRSKVSRKTKETEIFVKVNLEGSGNSVIDTGIPFFDHMLESFSKHSGIDIELNVDGDVEIDNHHSIEDTGLVLGKALRKAIDLDKINRFGSSSVPMDEALCRVSIDFCGRNYIRTNLPDLRVGEDDISVFRHFFRSLANEAGITLHIEAYGDIGHHVCEAMFKSFAVSFKQAIEETGSQPRSTKGTLDD